MAFVFGVLLFVVFWQNTSGFVFDSPNCLLRPHSGVDMTSYFCCGLFHFPRCLLHFFGVFDDTYISLRGSGVDSCLGVFMYLISSRFSAVALFLFVVFLVYVLCLLLSLVFFTFCGSLSWLFSLLSLIWDLLFSWLSPCHLLYCTLTRRLFSAAFVSSFVLSSRALSLCSIWLFRWNLISVLRFSLLSFWLFLIFFFVSFWL